MEKEKTSFVRLRAWLLSVAVVGAVLVVDQSFKWLAFQHEWFVNDLTLNRGLALGLGASVPLLVSLLLIIAVVAIVSWWQSLVHRHPVVIGLVVGGAVSNIVDRLVLGGVRDWLPVPVLQLHNNLADWAIVIGLGVYIMRTTKLWS